MSSAKRRPRCVPPDARRCERHRGCPDCLPEPACEGCRGCLACGECGRYYEEVQRLHIYRLRQPVSGALTVEARCSDCLPCYDPELRATAERDRVAALELRRERDAALDDLATERGRASNAAGALARLAAHTAKLEQRQDDLTRLLRQARTALHAAREQSVRQQPGGHGSTRSTPS